MPEYVRDPLDEDYEDAVTLDLPRYDVCPACGVMDELVEYYAGHLVCPGCARFRAEEDRAAIDVGESWAERHRGFGTNVRPKKAR